MYKNDEKNIQTKCPVCETLVMVNKIGNGDECPHCGWIQNIMNLEFPDRVVCPNLISLNKARKLYKEGRPLTPDFDDFIDGYNFYGEMEFTYNDITYGVMGVENVGVEFWGANTNKYEIFKDIEEFKLKSRIDGKFLKDIWHEVKNANWLQ